MPSSALDLIQQRIFDTVAGRNLVYNTCWEDPAVDREILALDGQSDVLVITSAGCNALDYLLAGARSVTAVDANPRQNALLELKVAAISTLSTDQVVAMFGDGHLPEIDSVFATRLAPKLSPFARTYWQDRLHWFRSKRGSFYFHGLSGYVAWAFRRWMRRRPELDAAVDRLFSAATIDEQRRIYDTEIAPKLWTRNLSRVLSSQWLMNLLGVPVAQRQLVERQQGDRAGSFIRESIEYVVRELPLADNYFWQLYRHGRYRPDCCPEYLRPANIERLRNGLLDRLSIHTMTVTDVLRTESNAYTHFVLLDHMDWMSQSHPDALIAEWQAILHRARPNARIMLRSAESRPQFLSHLVLPNHRRHLADMLRFHEEPIDRWQARDRVHTYAGLVVANACV